MTEQWALLWSKKQNAFHVEPVENWLSKNRVAYRDDGTLADYHPIVIGDRQTCEATADAARATLAAREELQPLKVAA